MEGLTSRRPIGGGGSLLELGPKPIGARADREERDPCSGPEQRQARIALVCWDRLVEQAEQVVVEDQRLVGGRATAGHSARGQGRSIFRHAEALAEQVVAGEPADQSRFPDCRRAGHDHEVVDRPALLCRLPSWHRLILDIRVGRRNRVRGCAANHLLLPFRPGAHRCAAFP
jgi:hypothetical protein